MVGQQTTALQRAFVETAEKVTARAERDVEDEPALEGLRSSLAAQRLFLQHLKTCGLALPLAEIPETKTEVHARVVEAWVGAPSGGVRALCRRRVSVQSAVEDA